MTSEQADTIIQYLQAINEVGVKTQHYTMFLTWLLMIGVGFYLGYKSAYK